MIQTNTGYIYKIIAPNGKIYIGQTNNFKKRKSAYKTYRFKNQIKLWNSCQTHNWNPIDTFEIIEEILFEKDRFFLNEREVYWISFYDSFNNGLNCTPGGMVFEVSEETKEKISKFNKGKILSEETKEKISKSNKGKIGSNKGKKFSAEHIKKIKETNTGHLVSDETKKKISEFNKGKKHKIESIIKMSGRIPWNKNKNLSEETKNKISESHKGKPWSEKRRLAQSK